jgi:hypothetical protein
VNGTGLVITLNGVNSTPIDLTPLLLSGTTNIVVSTGNTIITSVNGVSSSGLLINSLSSSLSGNILTTIVNGVSTSGAVISSHSVSMSGNILSSLVNGVASSGAVIQSHMISSSGNTLSSSVNGVLSTGSLVNSNIVVLNGTGLSVSINGVNSNLVDLTPALASGTTHTLTLSGNVLSSVVNGKTGSSLVIGLL